MYADLENIVETFRAADKTLRELEASPTYEAAEKLPQYLKDMAAALASSENLYYDPLVDAAELYVLDAVKKYEAFEKTPNEDDDAQRMGVIAAWALAAAGMAVEAWVKSYAHDPSVKDAIDPLSAAVGFIYEYAGP